MSYRFMRVLVMFDLPIKLAMNQGSADLIVKSIRKLCPEEGIVQVLQITEKQFSKMEFLVGESQTEYVDSDERFIEI